MPIIGQSQAPLTSPYHPSNHTITLNLTLTFVASWFGHASPSRGFTRVYSAFWPPATTLCKLV